MSRESDENFNISRISIIHCLDSIFGLKIVDTKHDDHLPSRYNPGIQPTHTYRYGVENEGQAARHGPIPDDSFFYPPRHLKWALSDIRFSSTLSQKTSNYSKSSKSCFEGFYFLDSDLSVWINLLFRQQLNGMAIHLLKPKHGEIHQNQQRFAGLLKEIKWLP